MTAPAGWDINVAWPGSLVSSLAEDAGQATLTIMAARGGGPRVRLSAEREAVRGVLEQGLAALEAGDGLPRASWEGTD